VETEVDYTKNGITVRPDAILRRKDSLIFVEFYKSHKVDLEKEEKLKKIGISTIEIDINKIKPLKNGEPNVHALRELIEESAKKRVWIVNTKQDQLLDIRREKAKKAYEDELKRSKEEYKRLQIEEDKRREREWKGIWEFKQWINDSIGLGYKKIYVLDNGSWPNFKSSRLVHCPKYPDKGESLIACKACEFHYNYFEESGAGNVFCGYEKSTGNKPREDNGNTDKWSF
jgi:hypothetical protein